MPTTSVVIPNMVKGPASATDDTFVKYDGTTGKLLKDGVAGSDGGNGGSDGGKVALFKSTGALEGRCSSTFGVKGTTLAGNGVEGWAEDGNGVYAAATGTIGIALVAVCTGTDTAILSAPGTSAKMFRGLSQSLDEFEIGNDGRLSWSSAAARSATRSNLGLGALALKSTVATADIDNDAVTNAKLANMATKTLKGRGTAGTGDPEDLGANDVSAILDTATDPFARTSALPTVPTTAKWDMTIAVSDETTDLTTGTAKVTFRMPRAVTLTAVRASVNTAPVGSTIIVDINESGSTILSTKLSIDAGEKTSTTAATPAVISDTGLADDAEITIDIDQVGSSTPGKGLKVTLLGTIAV